MPRFEAVKGLACLSKGMRQQLYTLLPQVDGEARPVHGPWEVVQNAYTEGVFSTVYYRVQADVAVPRLRPKTRPSSRSSARCMMLCAASEDSASRQPAALGL